MRWLLVWILVLGGIAHAERMRVLEPAAKLAPESQQNTTDRRVGGALLLLVAAGALAGSLYLGIASVWNPDGTSRPPADGFVAGAVILGLVSVGTAGGGASLLHSASERAPRPALSVSPTGVSGSLTWRF
jgi:hypothetical protein